MQTINEFELKIYSDGVIEVAKDTVYVKDDGNELTRERFRKVLEPGQVEEAIELLDDYHLNIVKAAWTDHVIELYQQKNEFEQATDDSGF